jgi:nitrous oxidase accessory protein
MYAQHNEVLDNHYEDNSVGIFLMYSDSVVIKGNYIAKAVGPTGIGIGFKETSDVTVEGNQLLHNAVGLYLDVSPYQPDTTNRISNNLIAYNGIGVRFLNDWQGNVFKGNLFKGNLTQVAVEGGKTAKRNLWSGNYWEDYEGFDRNHDGIGDTPYELYGYADRIWMDVPAAQFFKGTLMLEMLDFLERLAPFSDPSLLLRDDRPMMTADAGMAQARHHVPASTSPATGGKGFDALEALRKSLGRE